MSDAQVSRPASQAVPTYEPPGGARPAFKYRGGGPRPGGCLRAQVLWAKVRKEYAPKPSTDNSFFNLYKRVMEERKKAYREFASLGLNGEVVYKKEEKVEIVEVLEAEEESDEEEMNDEERLDFFEQYKREKRKSILQDMVLPINDILLEMHIMDWIEKTKLNFITLVTKMKTTGKSDAEVNKELARVIMTALFSNTGNKVHWEKFHDSRFQMHENGTAVSTRFFKQGIRENAKELEAIISHEDMHELVFEKDNNIFQALLKNIHRMLVSRLHEAFQEDELECFPKYRRYQKNGYSHTNKSLWNKFKLKGTTEFSKIARLSSNEGKPSGLRGIVALLGKNQDGDPKDGTEQSQEPSKGIEGGGLLMKQGLLKQGLLKQSIESLEEQDEEGVEDEEEDDWEVFTKRLIDQNPVLKSSRVSSIPVKEYLEDRKTLEISEAFIEQPSERATKPQRVVDDKMIRVQEKAELVRAQGESNEVQENIDRRLTQVSLELNKTYSRNETVSRGGGDMLQAAEGELSPNSMSKPKSKPKSKSSSTLLVLPEDVNAKKNLTILKGSKKSALSMHQQRSQQRLGDITDESEDSELSDEESECMLDHPSPSSGSGKRSKAESRDTSPKGQKPRKKSPENPIIRKSHENKFMKPGVSASSKLPSAAFDKKAPMSVADHLSRSSLGPLSNRRYDESSLLTASQLKRSGFKSQQLGHIEVASEVSAPLQTRGSPRVSEDDTPLHSVMPMPSRLFGQKQSFGNAAHVETWERDNQTEKVPMRHSQSFHGETAVHQSPTTAEKLKSRGSFHLEDASSKPCETPFELVRTKPASSGLNGNRSVHFKDSEVVEDQVVESESEVRRSRSFSGLNEDVDNEGRVEYRQSESPEFSERFHPVRPATIDRQHQHFRAQDVDYARQEVEMVRATKSYSTVLDKSRRRSTEANFGRTTLPEIPSSETRRIRRHSDLCEYLGSPPKTFLSPKGILNMKLKHKDVNVMAPPNRVFKTRRVQKNVNVPTVTTSHDTNSLAKTKGKLLESVSVLSSNKGVTVVITNDSPRKNRVLPDIFQNKTLGSLSIGGSKRDE